MKKRIPQSDSIQELARFWDTHDLTDFQEELEDVAESVFVRTASIQIPMQSGEAKAVRRIAKAKGMTEVELLREWVLQRLAREKSRNGSTRKSR